MYRTRKKHEEEEEAAVKSARRHSGSGGKGLIYRGLGRASMLGRGNGGRSQPSESVKLNVDEPDRYSNTSSAQIEVRVQSDGDSLQIIVLTHLCYFIIELFSEFEAMYCIYIIGL